MKHLNQLEQRLEQAAQEVRRAARHSVPPLLEGRSRPVPRGWLVFAVAFGAVILAVGVLPMLSRSGDPGTVGETAPTTSVIVTTTIPAPTTTAPAVDAGCSAAGMTVPAAQDGLPDPVADVRRAIAEAAIACDYTTLESLASPDLNTSFGGGGFDNLPLWEEEGTYPALALLVGLFDTPFATQDFDGLPRYYVWPSAFVYDTWDEIPAADLEALRAIYTDEELDRLASFGSYAGWRIGITETGEWRFFVAGD
ncbi:MAG: hypothetical protein ACRDWS_13135 [Acidimicrobiia bacterium]